MLHDIKSILHLIVIFQCLFFSFYLLTLKNIKRLSNIILAAFLLSKAISKIGGVFAHFGELREFVISYCPHLLFIHIPFHVRPYKIGRLGEPSSVIFHMFRAYKIIKTKEAIMKFY